MFEVDSDGWVGRDGAAGSVPSWAAGLGGVDLLHGECPDWVPSDWGLDDDGAAAGVERSDVAEAAAAAVEADRFWAHDGPAFVAAELSREPDARLWHDAATRDMEQVPDAELLELVAAWHRLEAAAGAAARKAAAVLASREAMQPPALARYSAAPCVAGDEIAIRLGISRQAGRRMVTTGQALGGALFDVGDVFAAGAIDAGKAQIYVEELAAEPHQVAEAVAVATLEQAPGITHHRLRQVIRSAVVRERGPDAAAEAEQARARRRVDVPMPLPGGMAKLVAVLPAADAMAVYTVCDATARHAATVPGEDRTLAQLRADTLVLQAEQALITGSIGDTGPCTAGATPCGGTPAAAETAEATTTADGTCGCGCGVPVMRLAQPGGAPASVYVTVAASTLLGLDDDAAELDGYGAIDASTARALAVGGVWRRIVTDPLTGAVLDVGTTTYKPTAAIARHVRARDGHCVAPCCTRPALDAQLDHRVPFPHGSTSAVNMAPLCLRHHHLKTHAGHTITRHADGSHTWRTPLGTTRTVPPHTPLPPPSDDPPPF